MNQLSKLFSLCVVFTLPFTPVYGRSVPGSVYAGTIVPVGEYGVFEILGDPRIENSTKQFFFRLWGVDVSSEALARAVGKRRFSCIEIGKVESNTVGDLRIVDCENEEGRNLSATLVFQGAGNPVCAERPLKNTSCLQ